MYEQNGVIGIRTLKVRRHPHFVKDILQTRIIVKNVFVTVLIAGKKFLAQCLDHPVSLRVTFKAR